MEGVFNGCSVIKEYVYSRWSLSQRTTAKENEFTYHIIHFLILDNVIVALKKEKY